MKAVSYTHLDVYKRQTVQNLTVVKVDTENNLIAVKGAVPGSKGTIITLANSVKA